MPNIDDLKSALNFSSGPALSSNYVVSVFPPLSLITDKDLGANIASGALSLIAYKQLSFLAVNASLPGRTLSSTPHRIYGTVREMPYGVLYEPISITFICTNSMIERTFFNIWQEYIMSPKSYYMNYYDDYVGRLVIQKKATPEDFPPGDDPIAIGGELTSVYILEEVYPKVIGAQEMSYSSKNEYLTLTVQFSYARWRTSLETLTGDVFGSKSAKSGVAGPTFTSTPKQVWV